MLLFLAETDVRMDRLIMRDKRINLPLTLITALLVVLIAGLTGSTLVVLRQMHGKSAHEAAETIAEVSIGQPGISRFVRTGFWPSPAQSGLKLCAKNEFELTRLR